MKLENIVIIENRLFQYSTQIYFENFPFDGDEFYVPVGDYTKPIGFLKFKQIAKPGCFELSELVSLDYPAQIHNFRCQVFYTLARKRSKPINQFALISRR
ncbi:hypothetical protein BANRA_04049 [Acinetobacter baumannii]|nr:hypothetical protein BANRA_04049 [Acinetobacter baumannii]